ncbi:MAG: Tm-1-like ATP-binding domain-containing protein [Anaerolineae bacterium]|nr:Tm-1-like ATP-binding domain-containing protein [Anaerolineae bacterium]
MSKTVLLIGTLDTKGNEFAYVRDLIRARGLDTLVMDVGIFEPTFSPDISADEVAQAAGTDVASLRAANDRGGAVAAMTRGVATLVPKLYAEGKFDGVLSLGGSGGTSIATAGMRGLPVGVPKVMVSTLASGDISPYVDVKDITFMYSVVDIAGLNKLSRRILANAAGMICGALEQDVPAAEDKPLIAATMFGVTTPCVTRVREVLEGAGYEVLVFHATGSGGRAMEALIEGGFIAGVADITTTEWCDQLVGGVLSAGEHRLEAAGKVGIPQVVSVGALDMVNFWAIDTVPEKFRERNLYKHNENVTLMRTTPEENAELGRIIAEKLNAANSPTVLMLPLRGVSMIDDEGKPFYWPEADQALFEAIRTHLDSKVKLVELDLHINDPAFATTLAEHLLSLLRGA